MPKGFSPRRLTALVLFLLVAALGIILYLWPASPIHSITSLTGEVNIAGPGVTFDGGTRTWLLTDSKNKQIEFQFRPPYGQFMEPVPARWNAEIIFPIDSGQVVRAVPTNSPEEDRLLEILNHWLLRKIPSDQLANLHKKPYESQSPLERQAAEVVMLRNRLLVERLIEKDADLDAARKNIIRRYDAKFRALLEATEKKERQSQQHEPDSSISDELVKTENDLTQILEEWESLQTSLEAKIIAAAKK